MTFPHSDSTMIGNPASLGLMPTAGGAIDRDELRARQVAAEFEAVMLRQLTAALGPSADEEDGDVFRSSATDMYRQMFSEQMATVMAKNGGIGLAELIVKQVRAKSGALQGGNKALHNHSGAVRNQSGVSGIEKAAGMARLLRGGDANTFAEAAPASLHVVAPATTAAAGDATTPLVLPSSPLTPSPLTPSPSTTPTSSSLPGTHRHHHHYYLSPEQTAPAGATRPRRVADRIDAHKTVSAVDATTATSAWHTAAADRLALQIPVRTGRLSSSFGSRRDPVNGGHGNHKGVDIAAPRGTPIEAAAPGRVVFAGWQGGYGNTVVIEHRDGRQTRYAHADTLAVADGDHVNGGQVIGTVGSTGRSTGPHLHFEVMENGHQVDPLQAIANDLTLARR